MLWCGLRPSSKVATVVRLCAKASVAVVPQGVNTSIVGGAIPSTDGTAVPQPGAPASGGRDPVEMTMTVDAELTLREAQQAAEATELLLPLSIS
jgi:FAD/FMN-containing dehydrogenase